MFSTSEIKAIGKIIGVKTGPDRGNKERQW